MKTFLMVAALVGLSATASAARDLQKSAFVNAPAPAYNWTGYYAGVNVGGGWTDRTNAAYAPNDPLSAFFLSPGFISANPVTGDSFKSSGVLGGFQLGYNYQFNRNWVAGLETDFQLSDIKGSGTTIIAPPAAAFTTVSEQIKYFGTVRARLGYLPTDKLLMYATGGFAYAQFNHAALFSLANGAGAGAVRGAQSAACGGGLPDACYAGSSNKIAPGYTIGGGLEYAIWQNWTVKGEYLYAQFRDTVTTFAVTPGGAGPTSSYAANFKTDLNILRLGANYKFAY